MFLGGHHASLFYDIENYSIATGKKVTKYE